MTVTDERLDDMRRRDREAGALWFTGPESFTALAARDRRELLTMLAEAQIAVTWNANMLADAQAQLAALQRDHAASAQDAARYRWLKDHWYDAPLHGHTDASDLDAIIDGQFADDAALAQPDASEGECPTCHDSGVVTIRGMCGGVEMDCDDQPCPEGCR